MYHLFCVGSFVPEVFAAVSFSYCPLWVSQQAQVEFPCCSIRAGKIVLLEPPYVPASVSFSFCRLPLRSHSAQHHLSMPMSHASWNPHVSCSCSVEMVTSLPMLSRRACEHHSRQSHGLAATRWGYWVAWGHKPKFHHDFWDKYILWVLSHIGTNTSSVMLFSAV